MFVFSLLYEIDIHLIAHEKLMTSVAKTKPRGVNLIAIGQHNAVKRAAKKGSHGVRGTVTDAPIEHFSLVCIDQSARNIGPIGSAIRAQQHRRFYFQERISQLYIVSSRQIIGSRNPQFVDVAHADCGPIQVL